MIGTTLEEIRTHVESLASETGAYRLVCARHGDSPIPAAGLRFDSRARARTAARATEQYRAALRRYDPQVPHHDIIVCQVGDPVEGSLRSNPATEPWTFSDPVVTGSDVGRDRLRVEFCHRIAAAVFEALSDGPHDEVQSSVMDLYFDLADALSDPDDLCLCLLESVAMELSQQLAPAAQHELLASAADRIAPYGADDAPVAKTFDELRYHGLIGAYERQPTPAEADANARLDAADAAPTPRRAVVRVSEYALTPRNGTLPVLPMAVDLLRHGRQWSPSKIRVSDADSGLHMTFEFDSDDHPHDIATVPVGGEVRS